MQLAQIKISGVLAKVVKKESKDSVPYFSYQFFSSKKDGSLDLISVKSEKNLNLEEGKACEIAVSVSTFNNTVYYKAL